MDRCSYYYLELLTYTALNLGFDRAEAADWSGVVDAGTIGIATGGAVTEHSPQSLAVVVAGPCAGYDKAGKRILIPSTQTVDLSLDNVGSPTTVVSSGNTKIVSLFVKFKRNPQTPATDGNGAGLFFDQFESYEFFVVQGAEGVSPTAPALLTDGLLLADVTRHFSDTTIATADISTTRREDAFVAAAGTISVRRGRAKEAVADLVTAVNTVVNGSVAFTGAKTFADVTATSTNRYKLASRAITRILNSDGQPADAAQWTFSSSGYWTQATNSNSPLRFNLVVPDGAVLTALSVQIDPPNGHGAFPANKPVNPPQITLLSVTAAGTSTVLAGPTVDGSSTDTAYEAVHSVTVSGLSITIDRVTKRYIVEVTGESGTHSATGLKVLTVTWTATITSQDDAAG